MASSERQRSPKDLIGEVLQELAELGVTPLQQTLTPAQTLRFYELRADLMERVQRLRQPGPGRRGPGGPGVGARGR